MKIKDLRYTQKHFTTDRVKFAISVLVLFSVMLGCSFLKEKFSEEKEESSKEKEETASPQDIIFYNKYLEVSKNISSAVDIIQKGYLNIIPNPHKINKNSFVFLIGPEVQLGFLETTIKNYKRSFYDGGELSKLEADNSDMKRETEKSFERLIPVIEDYMKTARRVIDYYTDGEYRNDLSKVVFYDTEIKQKYEEYEFMFDVFTETINKYKPKRIIRNPDDYSDPDEKVVVIIQNALETTIEKAESFNKKFKEINNNTDITPLIEELRVLEKTFELEREKVLSAEYSDMTKYMKYNYEDYFSKTVTDFISHADKFLDKTKNRNLSNSEFKQGYDDVILYYNLMITSYNATLVIINTFQTYK